MDSPQDDTQPSQDSVMTLTDDDRHEVLYFAYGVHANTEEMLERCPFSTPVGLGYLPGWKWIINDVSQSNIIKFPLTEEQAAQSRHPFEGVYGLLYLVPPRDEASLDNTKFHRSSSLKRGEFLTVKREKMALEMRWVLNDKRQPVPEQMANVKALVYVDMVRTIECPCADGATIGRITRGMNEMQKNWGLNKKYQARVLWHYTYPGPVQHLEDDEDDEDDHEESG